MSKIDKMIQDNLMPGERLLGQAHFSRTDMIFPIGFAVLLLLGFIGTLAGGNAGPEVFVYPLVGPLLVFIFSIPALINHRSKYLYFTNRNLYGKAGLVKKTEMSSPLRQVQNITVKRGFFGSLFKYGTVTITTGTGVYTFTRIRQPEKFKRTFLQALQTSLESQMDIHAEKIARAINRR